MTFTSTRSRQAPAVDFRTAVFQGLAPDGGLFHPSHEPNLRELLSSLPSSNTFAEIAEAVLGELLREDFPPAVIARLTREAFPFAPSLSKLQDQHLILELFHGPSCAFKDYGASFLAHAMEASLLESNQRAIILTATSGDTGSAVARAFYRRKNIEVVILYPSGRVSPLQEKQLTTLGDNVVALEVQGSFDDCQRMVKEAFRDRALNSRYRLTSANSINLGRLLPQALYYIAASIWLGMQPLVFCVPSGNFGNLTAGVLAWRWGVPVSQFIAATNANDVVPEYLQTGRYRPRASLQTYANAMDVGDPSNFERLQLIFEDSGLDMRRMISGERVDDKQILETIARIRREYGFFVDPHTAVGIVAAERYIERAADPPDPVVTLATAHPAKFLEVTEEATGERPSIPERLAEALELPKQAIVIDNTLEALIDVLEQRYST